MKKYLENSYSEKKETQMGMWQGSQNRAGEPMPDNANVQ